MILVAPGGGVELPSSLVGSTSRSQRFFCERNIVLEASYTVALVLVHMNPAALTASGTAERQPIAERDIGSQQALSDREREWAGHIGRPPILRASTLQQCSPKRCYKH